MKSEWKVTSNYINDKKMYAVYRLIDTSAVDHSGNREYAGEYVSDREACELVVKLLNAEENKNDTKTIISQS